MALVVVLAILAISSCELYVIIKIAELIGWLPTVGLMALDAVVGGWLLKTQGRQTWRRFVDTTAQGRIPHNEVLDGALVIVGAAFLMAPGFLTDAAGLVLLIRPTRSLVRRGVFKTITRRFANSARWMQRFDRHPRDYDVEGTASELNDHPPHIKSRVDRDNF
jgi:UPF0716 protein FxsA